MTMLPPREISAVVIGASAGGIDALSTLLPALDSRCAAAVLVVLHLPRERPSLLADLFRPRCALPVIEAVDKQAVTGGAVYLAPPDYHFLVERHAAEPPSVALSVDAPVHYSRPSIDLLFESAAECWNSRLMGVILSGANDDGARGLAAIARAGGITVAQDPEEALAGAMPAAAIRTGLAQHVLPLAGIGRMFGALAVET
jgi:two-component system chemotaxis response regulator CheB